MRNLKTKNSQKVLIAPTIQGIFFVKFKKSAKHHMRNFREKITFLGEIRHKSWSECPILIYRFSCTNISRKLKFAWTQKVPVKLGKCPWNLKFESGRETQNCPWHFLKKCPWKTWCYPCQKSQKVPDIAKSARDNFEKWKFHGDKKVSRGKSKTLSVSGHGPFW